MHLNCESLGALEVGVFEVQAGAASPSSPALLSHALKGANLVGEKVLSTYFIPDANSIQGEHFIVLMRTAARGDF